MDTGLQTSLVEDKGHGGGDVGVVDIEGKEMEKSDYLCGICWYHYASSAETLAIHKLEKHNTNPFLCEWFGCRSIMTDQESLDAHHQHVHERKTYFCPIKTCCLRFVTSNEWWEHVQRQHPEAEANSAGILYARYRSLDLAEMRAMRTSAMMAWEMRCGSEDVMHSKIALFIKRTIPKL